jgi:hypothetical protein
MRVKSENNDIQSLVPGCLERVKSQHARLRTKTVTGLITPPDQLIPGTAIYMIAPPVHIGLQYLPHIFGPADYREIFTSPIVRAFVIHDACAGSRYMVETESGSYYVITYDGQITTT